MPRRQIRLERREQVVEDREWDVRPRERGCERGLVAAHARREDGLLDGARVARGERVAHAEIAVGVALPGAPAQLTVGMGEERVDRPLGHSLLDAVPATGRGESDVAVDECAVDRHRAAEGDRRGAPTPPRRRPSAYGRRAARGRRRSDRRARARGSRAAPLQQPVAAEREQLGLDEGGGGSNLRLGGLRPAEAGDGVLIGGLDGVAQERVGHDDAHTSGQLVTESERLREDVGPSASRPRYAVSRGSSASRASSSAFHSASDAKTLAASQVRSAGDVAARDRHSGMLPCLRLGAGSRLARCISSARIRYGRVRRGSITSST